MHGEANRIQRDRQPYHHLAAIIVAAIVALYSTSFSAQAAGHHGLQALETTLTPSEWQTFKRAYVAPDGRVIDVEKNGVSHSEGQAYGMFLAVAADDPDTFWRIYSFTRSHMRGRSDQLISWIYNPQQFPRITDHNNATDGDIIIAYSLALAALKWEEPRFLHHAKLIIRQIADDLLVRRSGHWVIRPAIHGFDYGHRDGPVINLSYNIYGAFLLFHALTDDERWLQAWQSGIEMTKHAVSIAGGFAPDWVTLRSDRWLNHAAGFAPKSSYDAVRIPLYMALNGRVPADAFEPFHLAWNIRGHGAPKDFNLEDRYKLADMNDPGYRAIAALTACVVEGTPIPLALQRMQPTTYFATALHKLTIVAARTNYPWCVEPVEIPQTTLIASNSAADAPSVFADRQLPSANATRPLAEPRVRTAGGLFGQMGRIGLGDALSRFMGIAR